MCNAKKFDWKSLIVCLIIPLAIGELSRLLTFGNMDIYNAIVLPPLAPSSIVFPIVWSILYILMGVSCYKIVKSNSDGKYPALAIYSIQLVFNFMWSLIFFNTKAYLFAFIWLVIMWGLILLMIYKFKLIDKLSGWLQIPYLLWVTFAGYLNLTIYILNLK